MLWTPRRALVHICVILIVVGALFRLAAALIAHNLFATVLLPGSVDALACGALLALFGPLRLTVLHMITAATSAVAVILCWHYGGPSVRMIAPYSLALPLFYILTGGAAHGFVGPLGWVLSRRPLQYLGKISYGIYVIHYLVPQYIGDTLRLPLPITLRGLHLEGTIMVALLMVVSVTLAALSWRVFEHPINRNRDHIVSAVIPWLRFVVDTAKQNIAVLASKKGA